MNELMERYLNNEPTDDISFEKFTEMVKEWLSIDSSIKKIKESLKQKNSIKTDLERVITDWMLKYNIECLKTSKGHIKCKKSTNKTPVPQKKIKETINECFQDNEDKRIELLSRIYDNRPQVERVSLRRLKIT